MDINALSALLSSLIKMMWCLRSVQGILTLKSSLAQEAKSSRTAKWSSGTL